MEEQVLVNEIRWEYDYSKPKAEKIVSLYKNKGKYEALCELVKSKKPIPMVVRKDV